MSTETQPARQLSPQEAFDTVWAYFTKEGAQRGAYVVRTQRQHLNGRLYVQEDSKCAYRTPDGHACAVGCLLTDEDVAQHTWVRMNQPLSLVSIRDLPLRLQRYGTAELLRKLQTAHDDAETVEEMLSMLRDVASEEQLTVPA